MSSIFAESSDRASMEHKRRQPAIAQQRAEDPALRKGHRGRTATLKRRVFEWTAFVVEFCVMHRIHSKSSREFPNLSAKVRA